MVDLARQAPAGMTATTAPSSRHYVLGLLTTVYALNFLDRTIFNVLIEPINLIEPIKKEFSLSDTEMGLLAGFGFVLFYSTLGIPIARAADRLNRRNIVATALAFWSAMTFGADAVRYSLLSAAVTTMLGALLFVWAAGFVRTDIKRAS
jgi:MFS family permease